jgi:hypothetical protein
MTDLIDLSRIRIKNNQKMNNYSASPSSLCLRIVNNYGLRDAAAVIHFTTLICIW